MNKIGGAPKFDPLWAELPQPEVGGRRTVGQPPKTNGRPQTRQSPLPPPLSNRPQNSARNSADQSGMPGPNPSPSAPLPRASAAPRGAIQRNAASLRSRLPNSAGNSESVDNADEPGGADAASKHGTAAAASAAPASRVRPVDAAPTLAAASISSARSASTAARATAIELRVNLQQRLQELEGSNFSGAQREPLQDAAHEALASHQAGLGLGAANAWLDAFTQPTARSSVTSKESAAPAPLLRNALAAALHRPVPAEALLTDRMVRQLDDIDPGSGTARREALQQRLDEPSRNAAAPGARAGWVNAIAAVVNTALQATRSVSVPTTESLSAAHAQWRGQQPETGPRIDVPTARAALQGEAMPMFLAQARAPTIGEARSALSGEFARPAVGVLAQRLAQNGLAGMPLTEASAAPVDAASTALRGMHAALHSLTASASIAVLLATEPGLVKTL